MRIPQNRYSNFMLLGPNLSPWTRRLDHVADVASQRREKHLINGSSVTVLAVKRLLLIAPLPYKHAGGTGLVEGKYHLIARVVLGAVSDGV